MITGAHIIIYSTDAEADRKFIKEVLGFAHVDAGGGWFIFKLPPAEIAVHPHEVNDLHELYLMCDDVSAVVATLEAKGHACSQIAEQPWGRMTQIQLPGGGEIGLYEPKHPLAHSPR